MPCQATYLNRFSINSIGDTVDFIVFMGYNLHGQWDYNSPQVFDRPSKKCIRSHVNLTEIESSLHWLTLTNFPANKIVVGEANFGKSFRMASPGCWQAQCEFAGSASQSIANPGPCTNTSGFLSLAEIDDLLLSRLDTASFHDDSSDTDVVIYNGTYSQLRLHIS